MSTGTVSTGVAAMHELRATRKRHRLGDMEWFDAAYKVYIVGLFGGLVLLWLSDLVGDGPASAAQVADVARHGPAVLGMVAVIAFAAGLRSGSQGGPLALEAADVAHVMLAPVPRGVALIKPAIQRLRTAAFTGAAVCASLGQLGGRRLPGSPIAWFAGGGLFGLNLALLWVGAALVAHALRIPLLISTFVGVVAVAWQAVAVATGFPGPANLNGSLGLWGWRQRGIDVAALIVMVGLVALGLALVGRTSLDALARRSNLVAQLRFAVTMQDLRTVILLRRQLSHDRTRRDPWMRLAPSGGSPTVWRRGWHSLLRLPSGRLIRMVSLILAGAGFQVAALHGTAPAVVGTLVCMFVLGLEILEPLSQEVDQPDRTASFPIDRGLLMVRHLAAPAVALVPFALIGAIAATIVDVVLTDGNRTASALLVSVLLAFAAVFAGAAGATISIVRDAPDPMASTNQDVFLPPEMAGISTVLRTVIPLAVSALGALTVLTVRSPLESGVGNPIANAVRAAIAVGLLVAAVVTWVRYRDRVRRAIKTFISEGRTHTHQQRSLR